MPLLDAWRLQIAPLFNTLAHNNPPSSFLLPSAAQIYSDRKKQIIFPRYFSLRPNIRVIIIDLLLSSPFLTFFARFRYQHVVTRNSICCLCLSIQPLHTPTYPPHKQPPSHSISPPTHCDCEPRLAADCSVTHDTPLFLVPPLSPTDKPTRAKSMREKERST